AGRARPRGPPAREAGRARPRAPPRGRVLRGRALRGHLVAGAWLLASVVLAALYPSPLVRGERLQRIYLAADLIGLFVAIVALARWARASTLHPRPMRVDDPFPRRAAQYDRTDCRDARHRIPRKIACRRTKRSVVKRNPTGFF